MILAEFPHKELDSMMNVIIFVLGFFVPIYFGYKLYHASVDVNQKNTFNTIEALGSIALAILCGILYASAFFTDSDFGSALGVVFPFFYIVVLYIGIVMLKAIMMPTFVVFLVYFVILILAN